MKKLLFVLTGVAGVAALWFVFGYHPCNEPSEQQVNMVKLGCALKLVKQLQTDPTPVIDEICQAKGEEPGCQLVPGVDDAVIEKVLGGKVMTCTLAELKAQNMCIDKVK
jgi:hypothetical protein